MPKGNTNLVLNKKCLTHLQKSKKTWVTMTSYVNYLIAKDMGDEKLAKSILMKSNKAVIQKVTNAQM